MKRESIDAAGPTDADRLVDFADDGPLLPEQTRDDTDFGWGEHSSGSFSGNDDRLLEERPPHWE